MTKPSNISPPSLYGDSRLSGNSATTTAEWAKNKLHLDSLGIYGRKEETSQLQLAVSRMSGTANNNKYEEERKESANFMNSTTNNGHAAADKKEFMLVSGYSGAGKTTLVSSAIKDMVKLHMGGVFAIGKFDQCLGDNQQQHQPFTAFRMICQILAQEIFALKTTKGLQQKFEHLKDTIMLELGTELIDLIQIFPSLDVIISSASEKCIGSNGQGPSHHTASHGNLSSYGKINSDSRHRLIYTFRMLVRIIASVLSPIVFVLDDLQWADTASLELLEGLLFDRENTQLMIIGIYRSNEVDETHIFTKTLREVRSNATESGIRITEMEVGNLHINAVQEMIEDLLSLDDTHIHERQRVEKLAEICHRKTSGNAFYLIHFLSKLYDEQLLTYNNHLLEWEWNLVGIEQATKATENVVDILKQQMSILTMDEQQVLKFAAYLGSVFEERYVYILWKGYHKRRREQQEPEDDQQEPEPEDDQQQQQQVPSDHENTEGDVIRRSLRRVIKSCRKAGFFESGGRQKRHRWVHDKLQEAAMEFVPPEDHPSFSRQVAEALHNNLSEKELEAALFIVTNRYNEGTTPQDAIGRLRLAELNLRAAKKASSYSAFENVSTFCKWGIKLLPSDCWKEHYKLSLDLYSLGAEAEGCIGKVHKMEKYCKEVLRQEATTTGTSSVGGIRDKLRVYRVMMTSLENRNMSREASEMCMDVLCQYGTKIPAKSKAGVAARIAYNVGKIKTTIKSRTQEEAQNLKRMEDPVMIEQMGLLNHLMTFLYFVDKTLFLLPIFKSFNWTLEHGLCVHSPPVFASVALIFAAVLGDYNGAETYANYALILLNKLEPSEAKQVEAKTVFLVYNFTFHWTQPIKTLMKPMLRAYEAGIHSGDIENAIYSIYSYLWLSIFLGKSLATIEEDCRAYIAQSKQLKFTLILNPLNMMRQMLLNLMGQSQFKTRLTGVALKEDVCRKEAENDAGKIGVLNMHKFFLMSLFGDYEDGANLAWELGDAVAKRNPGMIILTYEQLHRGICFFSMARKLKRESQRNNSRRLIGWSLESKYLKSAKQSLAKIKNWIEQGNPNVRHYESLLDAELAAYDGRSHVAKKHYETAITIASQESVVSICALANERYGEYLLQIGSDARGNGSNNTNLQEAVFRLQESIDLYREWGAEAKAATLESTYSSILLSAFPSQIEVHAYYSEG